jgi:ABC-type ATPase involved in cell division
MFENKTNSSMAKSKPMKEDSLVNMVIAIITINKVLKNVAFKHKKNLSNPNQLSNGKKRKICINLLK